MASRDYLKHVVSTSEPVGSGLGDEYYSPSSNKLYKQLAVNGTSVRWVEQQQSLTVQSSGVTRAVGARTINFPGATIGYDSTTDTLTIQSSGIPGGANTNIQFNNGGLFSGSSNLTWDGSLLNVTGRIETNGSRVVDYKNATAQWAMSGGGLVTWTGASVLWSARVICIPVENNEMGSSGHFDINCPTSGTVVYYNSANVTTTLTATAAGIPLGAWEALYYEVTEGMSSTSDQTRFRVVNYVNTTWRPSTGWLLVAAVNGDGNNVGHLKWLPGQVNLPTTGATVTYNTGTGVSSWASATGTVTAVSVASANGFAGTSSGGATPALTLTTSITGLLKGNGTAISAATAGTDYQTAQSVTGIVKSSGTTRSAATAGTDYLAPPTGTALLKANSGGALANAVAGTDYQTAQSVTGIVKSSGTTRSAATAGTDYLAPAGAFNLGTTSITFNRTSASQSLTGINIDGSAGTAGSATSSTFTRSLQQTDGTAFLTPTDPRGASGGRAANLSPNQYSQGLFSEFKNSSLFGFTGNYTGLITYANWQGTTASTGDPSYQLAFYPNAGNATANPRLKFRAGIDTTWGAWGEVSHTGVTDLNIRHNSVGVNVAASANAGQISTTTAGTTNIVINNTTGTDRYFFSATGAVNSFTIYENSSVPYLNSWSGMSLRANQLGGTGGAISLSGGTVQVVSQLLDVTAATPATTNAIRAKSNIAWLSPSSTSTITSKMLDAGTLSFEGSVGQLFSITNSMTGTIFSVNDISGIPSIEVLDTGVVKLAQYSGFVAYGVSPSLTATGASQGTALALFRSLNNVTTVAASTGVVFPTATAGMRIVIRNGGANALNIYPAVGGQINSLGTNIAFSLPISTVLEFVAFSTTQWYTMNTTYA